MKKLILFLGVVAVIGFTSCKKEKTCKCETVTIVNEEKVGDPVVSYINIEGGSCYDLNKEESIVIGKIETKCKRD